MHYLYAFKGNINIFFPWAILFQNYIFSSMTILKLTPSDKLEFEIFENQKATQILILQNLTLNEICYKVKPVFFFL